MKTRVVKYWHQTDWLYRVDEWLEAKEDQPLYQHGYPDLGVTGMRKKGEWYWSYVLGGVSMKKAMEVAAARSRGEEFDKEEVVVEFLDGLLAS